MCAFAVGGKSARGGFSAVAAAADDGKMISEEYEEQRN